MSEEIKKPIIPQSRAVLIEAPGVGFVVRTEDGNQVMLTPGVAVDIARQILVSVRVVANPANRTPFAQ